ncbi:MAG TPA: GTP-binding protein [Fontimonas sp.]
MPEPQTHADKRLPVCLLTGFLGAGKSTLLNFLLRHPQMQGTAVVINEYGAVGIDHHLVESAQEETELVADGCLCCTASGQLAEALLSLIERAQRRKFTLRRVIIETTGLAEPAPILRQLLSHPQLREQFVLDSVVTLVDAINAPATLDTHDIAVQQITAADRLIVTKTDLTSEAQVRQLEQRLAGMNPDARVDRVVKGAARAEQFFDGAHRRAVDGTHIGFMFEQAEKLRFSPVAGPAGRLRLPQGRTPADQEIQTFSLILDEPILASTFLGWLDFLRTLCGPTLLRVKGLVNLQGQAAPTVVHGVQNVFHPVRPLEGWPSEDRRTRLVFITRGWGQDAVGSTLDWLRARSTDRAAAGKPA